MVLEMAGRRVIGVDLGGTKLLAGVVDEEHQVHHRAFRLGRGGSAKEVVDHLVEVIEEVREAAGGEVDVVGLGIPALVDQERGVAQASNHLPLVDVPVRDLVSERTGLPVVVDNDGNMAMLAEWWWGAAQGATDAVLLTLGTGIGGGLLCPGSCPGRGCLEAFVSGTALGREGLRVAHEEPDSALGRALSAGTNI